MFTEKDATERRDLGDGLLARWSTAADTENIAHLIGMVFREKAEEPENTYMANSVRRMMRGDYPLMGPNDYAVIEDTRKEGNPIVACTCLWRQTWEYEGIPFEIGRPEYVATDPHYRRRGLVRVLFDMVHQRSANEGHPVTAITGIPYFYRQFGYEYALDLGGKRTTFLTQIAEVKDGEQEAYTLREATREDIPLMQESYQRRKANNIIWTDIPDSYWRYELEAWRIQPEWGRTSNVQMIVDSTGVAQGYVLLAPTRWGSSLAVWGFESMPGANLRAMLPPVLRALKAYGEQMPTAKPGTKTFSAITFLLGRSHPVYDALGELAQAKEEPYAWYVRVPDLPAFLSLIAPVLEKRLADSYIAGYTGEIKLDFYRSGLRMAFDRGRLTTAENWQVPIYDSNAGGGFPELVFLQVIFGHRSIDELRHAFPDVWVNDETGYALNVLFPARESSVLPL
ncbi:MAG: GNAT family N-acetyltransferase [Chloroflexota bacterium]|nr:GNAT family N-acetyltransferase [Chloroflexota bacterium]